MERKLRLLIAGAGTDPDAIAKRFMLSNILKEQCPSVAHAMEQLGTATPPYDFVFLSGPVGAAERIYMRNTAARLGTTVLSFENLTPAFGGTPSKDAYAQQESDSLNEDALHVLNANEVEEWRNVLTFAKRTPDAYPALRDALGETMNLFQFHAPVKRSA